MTTVSCRGWPSNWRSRSSILSTSRVRLPSLPITVDQESLTFGMIRRFNHPGRLWLQRRTQLVRLSIKTDQQNFSQTS